MTQQRSKLDFLASINWHHSETRPEDTDLDARIESYELAYRMQSAAPEAVDVDNESAATKKLYGMDEEITEKFGSNCLLARRLVERGVRFVEAYCGSGSGWGRSRRHRRQPRQVVQGFRQADCRTAH